MCHSIQSPFTLALNIWKANSSTSSQWNNLTGASQTLTGASPDCMHPLPNSLAREIFPACPLAQPGDVLRDRLDLAITHARHHAAHHAVRIVGARAGPEGLELRIHVFGKLARDARILRRHARPRRAVAACASRDPGRGIAAAVDLLAERGEILVSCRRGLEFLRRVVRGDVLQVGGGETGDHAGHYRLVEF